MTEHYLHVEFTCIYEAATREEAEAGLEALIDERHDSRLANRSPLEFGGPASAPARLHPEERGACNVSVPGQRRALTRHYAAPQLAPRARWQGREYDFLGHASVFTAYDEDEWLHVLCDDDGHVLAVESDLYSGGLICRCQKCGRWSEDVSEGYGPNKTIVWECPEYCGAQADWDSGKWGKCPANDRNTGAMDLAGSKIGHPAP